MKKVSTNPNIIKPLTKDVIRKELSDDKQNFFFIESHQLYEIFKYTIPEYLQNLGVTIEEKPCFYKIETDKNIINITTTNNIKGFFNIIENKILLYYPVLLHEKNTKDFIETEQMSALAYTRIVQDETFYSLLHELRHAYNSQLIQKFSENKGISYTDLFEFAFFDEFSAEFSSMCARINNHYLYGYNFLFEGNSLCKNINKILCNNNNNKDEIFQKIKTYLYNYIKNGQKNQNYDTLYFLQTVKTYMNILQSKNLAKNQISEENFNSLKSKMLTFDLYNPQTKKLDSIDFSKYTEGFVKYNKNSIHEILGDLYKNYCK